MRMGEERGMIKAKDIMGEVRTEGRKKQKKTDDIPARLLLAGCAGGMFLSMAAFTAIFYVLFFQKMTTGEGGTGRWIIGHAGLPPAVVFFCQSMVLFAAAFVWLFFLTHLYGKKLSVLTENLCQTLDDMMTGKSDVLTGDSAGLGERCVETERGEKVSDFSGFQDKDTIYSRIYHQLFRLYQVMGENRRRVEKERRELQALISDISHQVKTPVSNLKMVTETLLTETVAGEESREFLEGIRSQTEKLDFLMEALVKMSRLETGVIQLKRENISLYDTVAQAMGGIVYAAEEKKINVSVYCPEELCVFHDKKWTAEALFNLLDNAVKYTPAGGDVRVTVKPGEMYVEIQVADSGKGIPESRQAEIFQRFYREEEVHNIPGIGIGLCLAREIVMRQGGFIRVVSEPGKGSVFSIFLSARTFQ